MYNLYSSFLWKEAVFSAFNAFKYTNILYKLLIYVAYGRKYLWNDSRKSALSGWKTWLESHRYYTEVQAFLPRFVSMGANAIPILWCWVCIFVGGGKEWLKDFTYLNCRKILWGWWCLFIRLGEKTHWWCQTWVWVPVLHFLALWPQPNHLMSLKLCFVFYKVRMRTVIRRLS